MSGHPGTLPLRLYRGDSYSWRVQTWSDDPPHELPWDLEDATAAATIAGPGGAMALDCEVTAPNIIDLRLAASSWANVEEVDAWDLQLSWPDDRVLTLLAGPVLVQEDVTP